MQHKPKAYLYMLETGPGMNQYVGNMGKVPWPGLNL